MLAAAVYFDQDSEPEREIRTLADGLYRRTDWKWVCNGGATVTHGWTPESGFCPTAGKAMTRPWLLYTLAHHCSFSNRPKATIATRQTISATGIHI